MRSLGFAVAAAVLFSPIAHALACDGMHESTHASFTLLNVEQFASLSAEHKDQVAVFDVNSAQTRSQYGVIPGAHLLTSAANYDVVKELPQSKDTSLVFYCANTQCTASHTAAERASSAGYTKIYVLSDGIQGWRKAGRATAAPGTTASI